MAEDVTEKEVEKAPRSKTADKPHHLSLFLSIAAIVISSLSWWEGHQNRILNEGVNRPILLLDSITPAYGGPDSKGGLYVSFGLKLKNVGKTVAKIQNYEIKPFYPRLPTDVCQFEELEANKVKSPRPIEILPGVDETFYGGILAKPGCNQPSWTFHVDAEITYADDSGKYYVQSFDSFSEVHLDELRKLDEHMRSVK